MFAHRKPLFSRNRRPAQPHWFLVVLSLGVLIGVTILDISPNSGTLSVTTLEQILAMN